jgi:hypothetical protein
MKLILFSTEAMTDYLSAKTELAVKYVDAPLTEDEKLFFILCNEKPFKFSENTRKGGTHYWFGLYIDSKYGGDQRWTEIAHPGDRSEFDMERACDRDGEFVDLTYGTLIKAPTLSEDNDGACFGGIMDRWKAIVTTGRNCSRLDLEWADALYTKHPELKQFVLGLVDDDFGIFYDDDEEEEDDVSDGAEGTAGSDE